MGQHADSVAMARDSHVHRAIGGFVDVADDRSHHVSVPGQMGSPYYLIALQASAPFWCLVLTSSVIVPVSFCPDFTNRACYP